MQTNSQTENKQAILRLTETWNARDRSGFLGVHHPEVVLRPSGRTLDHDALWENEQAMFRAFPDLEAHVESILEEDGQVLVCWRITGTHEGELDGIAPTGKPAEWREWALYRLRDGRVTEGRFLGDHLEMLQQLGVVTLPGE